MACDCYRCTMELLAREPFQPDGSGGVLGMIDPRVNRMFICATCGNKRCPHAADHRNACTGSNEPGQRGSLYEDALVPPSEEEDDPCPPHCCCCGPGEPCCDCGKIMPSESRTLPPANTEADVERVGAQCLMPNCRKRAPAAEAFCKTHRAADAGVVEVRPSEVRKFLTTDQRLDRLGVILRCLHERWPVAATVSKTSLRDIANAFEDAISALSLTRPAGGEEAAEGHFTAGRCAVHTEDELDGAAVFSGDGEPFCLIDAGTVVGGDPIPRAEMLARLLNEAAALAKPPALPNEVQRSFKVGTWQGQPAVFVAPTTRKKPDGGEVVSVGWPLATITDAAQEPEAVAQMIVDALDRPWSEEVERLREALEPFARAAYGADSFPDATRLWDTQGCADRLTVGHLRVARAALATPQQVKASWENLHVAECNVFDGGSCNCADGPHPTALTPTEGSGS